MNSSFCISAVGVEYAIAVSGIPGFGGGNSKPSSGLLIGTDFGTLRKKQKSIYKVILASNAA